ncbi:hypothetical protein C1H46_036785 [Malus baccata]|uniref:Uncharacterized protein n=1 Tax=Malus baccata TaxID=106549 RepID=A0A540KTX8_MALBA|nr:hypothetical protein C1H46_036785 [Malus baccata]
MPRLPPQSTFYFVFYGGTFVLTTNEIMSLLILRVSNLYKLQDLSTVLPWVLIVSRRTVRKNKFVDFMGEYHLYLIVSCGAVPIIIPRVSGVHMLLQSFELIHGVLLCEGEDIDPSYYDVQLSGFSSLSDQLGSAVPSSTLSVSRRHALPSVTQVTQLSLLSDRVFFASSPRRHRTSYPDLENPGTRGPTPLIFSFSFFRPQRHYRRRDHEHFIAAASSGGSGFRILLSFGLVYGSIFSTAQVVREQRGMQSAQQQVPPESESMEVLLVRMLAMVRNVAVPARGSVEKLWCDDEGSMAVVLESFP